MKKNKVLPLTETTYYILSALLEPAHGYLIIQNIEELSNDTVRMAAGTMYGTLENLLKLKYIQLINNEDKRRKVYQITETGKNILNQQYERYLHIVKVSEEHLVR
ncbi:MAG: PadR family transcriptional regulator [Clostridiales bacterium]|nr:PadR family transcriptional regulator [Clostridiales bacterium]